MKSISREAKVLIFFIFWAAAIWAFFFSSGMEETLSKILGIAATLAPFFSLLVPTTTKQENIQITESSTIGGSNIQIAGQGHRVDFTIPQNNQQSSPINELQILSGSVCNPAPEGGAVYQLGPSNPVAVTRINFNAPFSSAPSIVLSVTMLDSNAWARKFPYPVDSHLSLNKYIDTVTRYECYAKDIDEHGFNLTMRTWANNIIFGYTISWVAIGSKANHTHS